MKSLGRQSHETARDVEARVFLLVARMMDGQLPAAENFSATDSRRLGYLAEAAALLLGARNAQELLVYADRCRRLAQSAQPWAEEPLIAGGTQASSTTALRPTAIQPDALAAEWRLLRGLDISRYRSELPSLLVETTPSGQTRPSMGGRRRIGDA